MLNAVYFSNFNVTSQCFYKTQHTAVIVNLKPITKGHVLVIPLNTNIVKYSQLSTPTVYADYTNTIYLIQSFLYAHYKCNALNIAIQDGVYAGQSVKHLHTHLIPRYALNNMGNEVYSELNDWDGARDVYRQMERLGGPDSEYREERDEDSMSKEATELKAALMQFINETPAMRNWL